MSELITPIEILAEQFGSLPGVGRKTAIKYALSFIEMDEIKAEKFIGAVTGTRGKIKRCALCGNYSEDDLCDVCSDAERDHRVICVVEDVRSLMALERSRAFRGVYHILGGVISPIKKISPEKLRINELEQRVKDGGTDEVIIATNATLEGETTAMYLTSVLRDHNVRVSRLAYGLPAGGDIEFTDELTIQRALQGRLELK